MVQVGLAIRFTHSEHSGTGQDIKESTCRADRPRRVPAGARPRRDGSRDSIGGGTRVS